MEPVEQGIKYCRFCGCYHAYGCERAESDASVKKYLDERYPAPKGWEWAVHRGSKFMISNEPFCRCADPIVGVDFKCAVCTKDYRSKNESKD